MFAGLSRIMYSLECRSADEQCKRKSGVDVRCSCIYSGRRFESALGCEPECGEAGGSQNPRQRLARNFPKLRPIHNVALSLISHASDKFTPVASHLWGPEALTTRVISSTMDAAPEKYPDGRLRAVPPAIEPAKRLLEDYSGVLPRYADAHIRQIVGSCHGVKKWIN